MTDKKREVIQASVVLLIIVVTVIVTVIQTLPPPSLPVSAAYTEFSAQRAIEQIKVIAQNPRFVGEPSFEAARDYVSDALKELGLSPEIQNTEVTIPQPMLASFGWDINPKQNVENIVAKIDGVMSSDAILLVAHLDSIGGPGASDDASGVSVLLETARALLASPPLKNTVILLFTAPEETGLHGSTAFILEHPWVKDVKLVINFDAGGLSGPSELTNISLQSGWLIRNFAKADPFAFATSGFGIGDSDFNTFKYFGFSGYAFDFARDRRRHSSLDNIANLNPSSIQHQGYHALYLARYFGDLDSLADPKEPDLVFFNFLRLGLIYYPKSWVMPIGLVCTLLFTGTLALGVRKKHLSFPGIGLGALVFIVSLITAPLIVRLLWALLSAFIPIYQVRFYGHAVNEPLLLGLFASVEIAVISVLYALLQKVKKVSLPDLIMGALVLLFVATIYSSLASPESSFQLTWSLLFTLLATGYLYYSMTKERKSLTTLQIFGLLVAAIIAIILILPGVYMEFTGSNTDDLIMPMVMLAALMGFLIAPMYIITKPYRWWLPIAASLIAIILFVFVVL